MKLIRIAVPARHVGIASDVGFRMPSVWFAEGHNAVAPVYLYRFDYASPLMKLLLVGGPVLGGVDALVAIGRTVWWAWPFAVLAELPGPDGLARALYRWIATNRQCLGDVCSAPRKRIRRRHPAATTFLELP